MFLPGFLRSKQPSTLWSILNTIPHLCLLCDRPLTGPDNICRDCEEHLPWQPPGCERCGLRTTALSPGRTVCSHCAAEPPVWDRCLAVFDYQPPVNALIAAFKYRHCFAEARALGKLMSLTFERHYVENGLTMPDCLLPVPLHPKRLRHRGFNQAVVLARSVSRHAGVKLDIDSVKRRHHTSAQKGQGRAERNANMRQAFVLSEQHHIPPTSHIAIVDDVVTTGATTSAIARLLCDRGVRRVDVWCVARVRPEGNSES